MARWVKTNLDDPQDTFDKHLGRHKILTINYGDFELDIEGDPFNYRSAERIAALLSNRVNIDDIGPCAWDIKYDENQEYPRYTIGGCGMELSAPSQGNVYAILASAFSGYAIHGRHELYLGKTDYYHLRDCYESYCLHLKPAMLEPLRKTLEQFRVHYSEYDGEFLLELIRDGE